MKDSTIAILLGGAALALGLHLWTEHTEHKIKRCIKETIDYMDCDVEDDDIEKTVDIHVINVPVSKKEDKEDEPVVEAETVAE